ncbi:MAG: OsmC family protein [Candidatus Thorarchaeota archaeon]
MKSNWVKMKTITIEVEGKPTVECSPPSDFWPDGPGNLYSPEDFFMASAIACYGLGIQGVALRYHADFKDFHVTGEGNLIKAEYGWEFEKISLTAKIIVAEEKHKKKMIKVAERAHTYCVIANSMKCPVYMDYEIVVE